MSTSTTSSKTGATGSATGRPPLPTTTYSAPPIIIKPTATATTTRPALSTYGNEKAGDLAIEVQDVNPSTSNFDSSPNFNEPVTKANALHLYQSALGIPPPKPIKHPKKKKNEGILSSKEGERRLLTDKNKGVYHQVMVNERQTRYKYYFCNAFITAAMFLQIVLAAAVTAFGAGQSSHIIITVFGAASTALASLLAVFKSQGLPNRMRQDWIGWRQLREYIEEMEREIEVVVSGRVEGEKLGKDVSELKVWDIVKGIEARYTAVRLTGEANRPDTYIQVPTAVK